MNVEIAGRLADRRRDAGYSQEDLAERLGVSRQAVSKWERSESSPDTNNLIALAKLYDVSLDELLYVDHSIEDDIAFETQDRAEEADQQSSTDSTQGTGGAAGATKDGDYVHVSFKDGVHVKDGADEVHVSWDGIHIKEDGETVFANAGPVIFDQDGILQSVGIDDIDIFARKTTWLKFPFPLVALIAYLLVGFLTGHWLIGLSVFISIPLYYTFVNACIKRTISTIITTVYTAGITVWFFYMGLTAEIWHPTWLIFLTIPIMSWLASTLFKEKSKSAI